MAKTAKDYPITYKFGYSVAYGGWHSGVDRPTPLGTPIVVNKTTLGKTGNTGYSTGPHHHLTKIDRSGRIVDPGTGGFKLSAGVPGARPRVLATGEDSRNGKWVKVRTWTGNVYVHCHLSKISVKAGQRIY